MSKKIKQPVETPIIVIEPNPVEIVVPEAVFTTEDIKQMDINGSMDIQTIKQGLEALNIGMGDFEANPKKMELLLETEEKRQRITKAFTKHGCLGAVSGAAVICGHIDPGETYISSVQDPGVISPDPSLDTETTPPYNVGE